MHGPADSGARINYRDFKETGTSRAGTQITAPG